MSKKTTILVLFLLFSLGLTISCGSSNDAETEKLRKEVEEMKQKKTDQEIAELKEKLKDQEESEKEKTPAPQATSTPKPKVAPPVGSTVAVSNTGNVVVRDSPSMQGKKVTGLRNGEKVYVIGESANTDDWKGTQFPWKNIQKEDGTKGWVLGAFVDE